MLFSYVLLVFLFIGSYLLILEFESWITGVCSPDVLLHTMSSGNSLLLLWMFPFGMLCLSAIIMVFVVPLTLHLYCVPEGNLKINLGGNFPLD